MDYCMERLCDISFESDYSIYSKKVYSVIINRICNIYYEMMPEVFDEPFTVHITKEPLKLDGLGGVLGKSDAYNCWITEQDYPSFIMLTALSDTIAHEIAHTLISRKTDNKINGKYSLFTREGNNYVHFAANDAEYHDNSMGYVDYKTYIEPALLQALRIPFLRISYFKIDKLVKDGYAINTLIANHTAPTGRHSYY